MAWDASRSASPVKITETIEVTRPRYATYIYIIHVYIYIVYYYTCLNELKTIRYEIVFFFF